MAHPGSPWRAIDSLLARAASCESSGDSIGSAATMGREEASRRVDARLADAGCRNASSSSMGCSTRAEAVAFPGLAGELRFAVEHPVVTPAANVKMKHPTDPRIVSFDMILIRATGVPCSMCASPRKCAGSGQSSEAVCTRVAHCRVATASGLAVPGDIPGTVGVIAQRACVLIFSWLPNLEFRVEPSNGGLRDAHRS